VGCENNGFDLLSEERLLAFGLTDRVARLNELLKDRLSSIAKLEVERIALDAIKILAGIDTRSKYICGWCRKVHFEGEQSWNEVTKGYEGFTWEI
jgi:hypothetical protein